MTSETAEKILDATHRALCTHGFADLTMQRIAAHSTMTSATIHYHFDTKEELLDAFLEHILDRFEARLACEARDPRERLTTFLDAVFEPAQNESADLAVALMEIKAQAPHNDAYRARLREMDERMRTILVDAIEDGIDAGHFPAVDSAEVAQLIVTVINGAHSRHVALGESPALARRAIETTLSHRLDWTPEAVA